MKTIPFKFRFEKRPQTWSAEIRCGKRLTRAVVVLRPQARGVADTREVKQPKYRPFMGDAAQNTLAKFYPRFRQAQKRRGEAATFEQFRQQEIENEQALAVDLAAFGIVHAPENHVAEFWTAEHVQQLARALKRPRKAKEVRLAWWLFENWQRHGLCDMTREQLARKANAALRTAYKPDKPDKIWQTAYRLGLCSDRKSGPPARDY